MIRFKRVLIVEIANKSWQYLVQTMNLKVIISQLGTLRSSHTNCINLYELT